MIYRKQQQSDNKNNSMLLLPELFTGAVLRHLTVFDIPSTASMVNTSNKNKRNMCDYALLKKKNNV